ncbi:MAG: prephenate dehydrogenase/arogenate dehydrogenase family protein [Candidatus Ratteibacteria bacterium]|nr:prephenate dehydrogenase/arogenate dehydrogenase family protein [Candidatus Ratteibacteria bacterium]
MAKFQKVGITGIGLIGGSLALDIKKRKIAKTVVGFSRRQSTLEKAKAIGLVDACFSNFEDGIKDIDLLVLATPIGVIKEYFLKIKKHNPGLLVTDVASVKSPVVKDAIRILGKDSNFVGSHPIAGSDRSGIDAVRKNLFEGKFVIITPCRYTKGENISKIQDFWAALGSTTVILSPEEHDRLLALTSHIPHFIVYLLLSLFDKFKDKSTLLPCIGTGFIDTTRIGGSSPEMWAEIFIANRKNILGYLSEFKQNMSDIVEILKEGDVKRLTEKLAGYKKVRDELDEKRENFQGS